MMRQENNGMVIEVATFDEEASIQELSEVTKEKCTNKVKYAVGSSLILIGVVLFFVVGDVVNFGSSKKPSHAEAVFKNLGKKRADGLTFSNFELMELARARSARPRKDFTELSEEEANDYVKGLLRLKESGEYDQMVFNHYSAGNLINGVIGSVVRFYAHRSPSFFAWHRAFTLELELRVSIAIGDIDFRVPYWDWTETRRKMEEGLIPVDAPEWTKYFGGNGNPELFAETPVPRSCGCAGRLMDGPFANWTLDTSYGNGFGCNYLSRQIYSFPGNEFCRSFISGPPSSKEHLEFALGSSLFDESGWGTGVGANSFRNTWEGWVRSTVVNPNPIPNEFVVQDTSVINHNQAHSYVGGSLGPLTSPNDPVFFLIHGFTDRGWSDFIQRHNTSAPYLPNVTGVSGIPPLSGYDTNLQLTLPFKPSELIDTLDLGYYYTGLQETFIPHKYYTEEENLKIKNDAEEFYNNFLNNIRGVGKGITTEEETTTSSE